MPHCNPKPCKPQLPGEKSALRVWPNRKSARNVSNSDPASDEISTHEKSPLEILQLMIQMHGESDRHLQVRYKWDSVPHSARRISVGSVRSARSTAGSVATSAVSRMAHAGSAIISASVALTW